MIRIAKLTDYAIVLLTYVVNESAPIQNARDLSVASRIPLPTVSKILKSLSKSGILTSLRGTKGGYGLAREAREVSVADIIAALEGPIAVTECSAVLAHGCQIELGCPARSNWQKINSAVRGALSQLTLAEMSQPLPVTWNRPESRV